MTRPRFDEHSTEFAKWIRSQKDIDSYLGYRGYNLDFIWWLKKGFEKEPEFWMLIEEKRYMSSCRSDQALTYDWLHEKITRLNDPTYKGFHLLQFENTSPEDGKIFLNKKEITMPQLLAFLRFEHWGIV
ncbi:MAG: hypothetical protein WC208_16525 [Gallionella sp.]|jgi:hypothetical protein